MFDAERLEREVSGMVRAGAYAAAARVLAEARTWSGGSSDDARATIAYYEATVFAYGGDFGRAAARLDEYLRSGGDDPANAAGFFYQNSLIMLRLAQADPEAALIACYEAGQLGAAGTWTLPGQDRETVVRLKELWHRAYVLRMLAERVSGAQRAARLAYATRSREQYRALAASMDGHADSIAVLDAYFAVLDGDKAAARAAATKVNIDDNGDLEDLYLALAAFELAGDAEHASAIRKKILDTEAVYLAVPIIRMWVARDAANAAGGAPRWTPRYPSGAQQASLPARP